MSVCLKRLASSILLQYDDGRESKGLVGENFRLDGLADGVLLRIDLSNNFEMRNRGLYCHRAARVFTRAHAHLSSCRINDLTLSSALQLLAGKMAGGWQLEFEARRRRFRYAARPLWEQGHMTFLVDGLLREHLEPAQRRSAREDLRL